MKSTGVNYLSHLLRCEVLIHYPVVRGASMTFYLLMEHRLPGPLNYPGGLLEALALVFFPSQIFAKKFLCLCNNFLSINLHCAHCRVVHL